MKKKLLIVAFLAANFGSLSAEEVQPGDTYALDDVVISATTTERSKKDVAVSVDSVPEETVQKKPAQSILEVLRDVPGVTLSDSSGSGLKYVRIRGEASRRTLILIDGHPLSQQKSMDGGIPLIGKSQIQRIEVIKGPASVLHGSEAIGGVINIITKKGGERMVQGSVGMSVDGSNDGKRQHADLRGTVNGIEYAVFYGKSEAGNTKTPDGDLDENGYSAKDSSKKRISGSESNSEERSFYVGYKGKKVHAGVRHEKHEMDYQVYTTPVDEEPVEDVYMDIPKSERTKTSAFLEFKDLTPSLKSVKLDGFRQKVERDFDIYQDMKMQRQMGPMTITMFDYTLKTRTHNEQVTDGLNLKSEWGLGNHYVVAGVTSKKDDIGDTTKTKTRTGNKVGSSAEYEQYEYDAEATTTAVYLQDEWKLSDASIFTGGLRYTRVQSELKSTDDPDIERQEDDATDSNYSVSLGAVHHLNKNLTLRASYSQGYRYPNLVELYIGAPKHGSDDAKQGNPDLKPETSDSYEVGTRYAGHGAELDLVVFHTKAEDYITTDSTEYINIGGADTWGAEISASYRDAGTGLSPYALLTHLQRKLDYGDGKTTTDSGVAAYSGRYGLKYLPALAALSGLEVDLYEKFSSEVDLEESDGTQTHSSSWETLNLEITYALEMGDHYRLELFGGAYNMLDKDYEPFDELPAAGRHYVAGVNAHF